MANVFKGVEGAMRGYRPQVDWGGDEGPATIKLGSHNVKVGTAGWRKRCLFILLIALLLISVLNLILTFWMLRKIGFNAEGAGSLRVMVGGVKLEGTSRLDHDLQVSKIRGQPSRDLEISGYYNISLATSTKKGDYGSGFVIDSSGVKVASKGFRLKDTRGNFLFESKLGNVSTDAKFFIVTGNEGAIFKKSLETPRIQGIDVHEFRVESRTRSIIGSAGNLLRIEARDGDVTVTAINDVALTSSGGKFRFESSNVFLPFLFTAEEKLPVPFAATTPATETQIPAPEIGRMNVPRRSFFRRPNHELQKEKERKQHNESVQVFQVCVCPSGRLFLAAPDSVCIPDEGTCR